MATVTSRKRRRGKKERQLIAGAVRIAQQVSKCSQTALWINFDREADVLYISLRRPQNANDTVELDDQETLLRYRDDELVGITLLNASRR